MFAYVVELVTEDVDAFAVVVDDVETTLCHFLGVSGGGRDKTYVADSAKHIATPKKNVENTTTSAVVAVSYLGCRE